MKLKSLLFAALSLLALASCSDSDDPYMTLGSKTLEAEAEGGTYTVNLAANVYYRVNNDCQADENEDHWAVIDSYVTEGETTKFTIKVSENSSTEARTGTIRFIGDDVTPLKLTLTQKGVVPKGINPTTAQVENTATEASFKVYGDKEWTATCEDADVTVSPASGVGDCDVKLTFPENKTLTKRSIKVTVSLQGDKDYTYTLEQAAYSGVLADWDLNALTANTSATFADDADQTTFPGTNGKYVAPSTGNGKIEYWACDRTGYTAYKGTVCKRAVGGNGDPYVSGSVPGDYWYVYANLNGTTIPAGTKIHFSFVTKVGLTTSNYLMLEYKDGESWEPALKTSTVQESTTVGLSGATVDYSATVTYNFDAGWLLDSSKKSTYVAVEGTFTTSKDMTEIVMRLGQAGHMTLVGSSSAGKYIDMTHTSGQTRFSAQRPNNTETGAAVKVYDQHVLLEIVE